MVDVVNSIRIQSKKYKLDLASHHSLSGVILHHHVRGALVELHSRVLQLPEHEGLRKRENGGDDPGDDNH